MSEEPRPEVHADSSIALLETISRTLSQYIAESNPYVLFNGLLDDLLRLTGSEYGFIGEVFYSAEGLPYIQSYATTDISWDQATLELYQQTADKGMIFAKMDTLYGEVLKTSRAVISNDPRHDPRSGGLPQGHPPLNCFLGLPLGSSQELLGVVGIANRAQGYDQQLINHLDPFITTCSNLIRAYRNNVRRRQVESELLSYKKRLSSLMEQRASSATQPQQAASELTLGADYRYLPEHHALLFQQQQVQLSRKETLLMHLLATRCDQVVPYRELEQQIWPNVIVDESSMRSLLRRLRQKTPGLLIDTVTGVGCILATPGSNAEPQQTV